MVDGNKIKLIHSPLKYLKINTSNRQIIAITCKTWVNKDDRDSVDLPDIKAIYQQNNYQNQLLYTIYKQADNIDNKINNNENNKVDQFNQNNQHPFSSTTSLIFKPIITQIKIFWEWNLKINCDRIR